MNTKIWPIVGLSFGSAVGFAGAFGGFGAFLVVLLLGVLGFLVGRIVAGELDVGEVFSSLGGRKSSSS